MEIVRDGTYDGKMVGQEKQFSGKRIQALVKAGREAGLPHDNTVIPKKTTGWTDCGCGDGFDGGIVLDPFMGSGTVGLVAYQNNRHYIGIELNPEYCKLKRIQEERDKYGLFEGKI